MLRNWAFYAFFALCAVNPAHAQMIDEPLTKEEIANLAAVPRGTIIIWHRKQLPIGWQICDGKPPTPNLVGFIPIGVASPDSAGTNTGSSTPNSTISVRTKTAGETVPDQWGWSDDARRDLTPAATGLNHSHDLDIKLPTASVVFLMKVR